MASTTLGSLLLAIEPIKHLRPRKIDVLPDSPAGRKIVEFAPPPKSRRRDAELARQACAHDKIDRALLFCRAIRRPCTGRHICHILRRFTPLPRHASLRNDSAWTVSERNADCYAKKPSGYWRQITDFTLLSAARRWAVNQFSHLIETWHEIHRMIREQIAFTAQSMNLNGQPTSFILDAVGMAPTGNA